jgi:lysozyme
MNKAIDIATKLIKLNEGCKLEVYTCPAGKPTFGYGTNLEAFDDFLFSVSEDGLFKCAGVEGAEVDFSYGLDAVVGTINNLQDKEALEALAAAFLETEIINCKRTLNTQKWFTDDLSEFQQAIILDLAYNIGVAGVLKFQNMIEAIKQRNYGIACEEMLDSKYHYQMICYGYKDELEKAVNAGCIMGIDCRAQIEQISNSEDKEKLAVEVREWYANLPDDSKKLRSMSNALSLQFDKPLGKYKEFFK